VSDDGSITHWIGGLKSGDAESAQHVWERYFARLVRMARDKLRGMHGVGADRDEEDVALSALKSVCMGAAEGRFPRLGDRNDLWGLLVVVTARKARNQARDALRLKRGGGRVRAETDLASGDPEEEAAMARVIGQEPTPEFAAMVAEEFERRLLGMGDDTLRRIALLKLEGYTNEEIGAQLGCVVRTVERKLDVIRKTWQREDPP
jgi:DNA-directed RNA polymerase specialized sigma24 family protein